FSHYHESETPLDKIYLVPDKDSNEFALNGLILENSDPGLIYSSIGVNGAKFSDYNKYQLFFEQLKSLKPDLVVLSLGTNESFDKMASSDYMLQLDLFLKNMKSQGISVPVLVTTPPPSLFKRKFPNTFAADYSENIVKAAEQKGYAAWDLYSQLGGLYGVGRSVSKGLIGSDRVHYSKAGYEMQGGLLSEAILKAYSNFNTGTNTNGN
ncbi:MAG TPA: GDSL-type esterase/lipase family protein, partial [Flavobacterium sp.]|nr:GDSL-type esterase/lipase family protein [Flavobacterium sp.]